MAKWNAAVDFQGPTISIIKSSTGRLFGGFLSQNLTGANTWYVDANAFLFSLDNLVRLNLKNPADGNAFYSGASSGPWFGASYDLQVVNNANASTGSYTQLGYTYQLPAGITYNTV